MIRIQKRENAPKCIMGRDTVGQIKKFLKPDQLGFPKAFYVNPGLSAADDSAYSDQDNIN